MPRIDPPLPQIAEPGDLLVGRPGDGRPTILPASEMVGEGLVVLPDGTLGWGATAGERGPAVTVQVEGETVGTADPINLRGASGVVVSEVGGNVVVSFDGQRPGVTSFNVQHYGAIGDGSDDIDAIQTTIDEVEAVGGGDVFCPVGVYGISSSIVLANKVRLVISPGATIKWIGAAGGTMIRGTNGNPLQRSGVIGGGTLDPNGLAGYVFDLRSPQFCEFGPLVVLAGTPTTTVMRMRADVTNATGYSNTRNAIFNWVHDLYAAGVCGTIINLEGSNAPAVEGYVTLNEFRNIQGEYVHVYGVVLTKWADSNHFTGVHRYALQADNAIGVKAGNTASDEGVYNDHWDYLAPDCFGSFSNRIGIVLGPCKEMRFENFFMDPEPEGGAFVTDPVLTQSYEIIRTGIHLDGRIIYHTGGTAGGGAGVHHIDGLAVEYNHRLLSNFDLNRAVWLVATDDSLQYARDAKTFIFVIDNEQVAGIEKGRVVSIGNAYTNGVVQIEAPAGRRQVLRFSENGVTKWDVMRDLDGSFVVQRNGTDNPLIIQPGGAVGILDGITAPTPTAEQAYLYIDNADNAFKIKFGNGVVKTLATNP